LAYQEPRHFGLTGKSILFDASGITSPERAVVFLISPIPLRH